jgi:hypothetical protein
MIFMLGLFGYLCLLIFYKWIYYDADGAACAPSILITLINMVLMKESEIPNCPKYAYEGQVRVAESKQSRFSCYDCRELEPRACVHIL